MKLTIIHVRTGVLNVINLIGFLRFFTTIDGTERRQDNNAGQ